jgi:hypothetical protein
LRLPECVTVDCIAIIKPFQSSLSYFGHLSASSGPHGKHDGVTAAD